MLALDLILKKAAFPSRSMQTNIFMFFNFYTVAIFCSVDEKRYHHRLVSLSGQVHKPYLMWQKNSHRASLGVQTVFATWVLLTLSA